MALRCRAAVASGLIALLAACSEGPTGYTRIDPVWGSAYGYSDKRIAADEFSVFAAGNPASDARRVAEIALLRAAHLTLEQDRSHFIILRDKVQAVSQEKLVSVPVILPGFYLPIPVASRSAEEQVAILVVRLLPKDAEGPPDSLDASAIVAQLGERLGTD